MEPKNGRKFNEYCGIAKVKTEDNSECYVVFADYWKLQESSLIEGEQGGVIGKGETEIAAMEDALKRLVDFRRKSFNVQEAIDRVGAILSESAGGHDYEDVLTLSIDEGGEIEKINASVCLNTNSKEFSLCL